MSGPKSGTAACRRVAVARQMPIGADRATDSAGDPASGSCADVAVQSWFGGAGPAVEWQLFVQSWSRDGALALLLPFHAS
jgi:hypothetical protein